LVDLSLLSTYFLSAANVVRPSVHHQ